MNVLPDVIVCKIYKLRLIFSSMLSLMHIRISPTLLGSGTWDSPTKNWTPGKYGHVKIFYVVLQFSHVLTSSGQISHTAH